MSTAAANNLHNTGLIPGIFYTIDFPYESAWRGAEGGHGYERDAPLLLPLDLFLSRAAVGAMLDFIAKLYYCSILHIVDEALCSDATRTSSTRLRIGSSVSPPDTQV